VQNSPVSPRGCLLEPAVVQGVNLCNAWMSAG
jgi:hypothetical protein